MRRPCPAALLIVVLSTASAAQTPAQDAQAMIRQAQQRIRELQQEADRLAAETGTLLADLRGLELQREIKTQELARAGAEYASVVAAMEDTAARLRTLEAQRLSDTPGVRERLVEVYKRGRGGYLRMLLAATDMRALGRLTRGVASVARLDQVRLEAHRRTLRAERDALKELEQRRAAVSAAQAEIEKARDALNRAVAAHNRRLDDLDRRRDLAAQYLGELQAAQSELQKTMSTMTAATVPTLPLAPFRGSFDWPSSGRLLSRFGRAPAGRFGTAIVRNGIEIAAAEGAPVRAIHGGTIAYAAPFTGYATLVIVDHGQGAFSLYGHLSQANVQQGARVSRGDVVGVAGRTPAGQPAVYFELRIDGRPVDPVQWLRSAR